MPESRPNARHPGRLVGVGIGPGDPDLVTVKAQRAIRDSDRVVAPSTALDAVGRAEAIVREAVPGTPVDRFCFDMSRNAEATYLELATTTLVPWLQRGLQVAFVTIGDPNIYSTFSSVARAVRSIYPDAVIDTVPGIMAFQALAAATGTVLVDGTESLSLVTALNGVAQLRGALAEGGAVVVYKGGRYISEVRSCLESAGRLDGALCGELLGWPGEQVIAVSDLDGRPASYLSTVIVPPVQKAQGVEPATGSEPAQGVEPANGSEPAP